MAATVPVLDLIIIDTYNPYTIGIGDLSTYPENWTIVSPTIEITPPGWNIASLTFTPSNVNIYNSGNLGITCDDAELAKLPDGIYSLKYTINPAYTYFVEKKFLRIDNIMESLDTAWMKLDIAQCDPTVAIEDKKILEEIETYIQFAIAAANKCAITYAIEAYQKAKKMIDRYNSGLCKTC